MEQFSWVGPWLLLRKVSALLTTLNQLLLMMRSDIRAPQKQKGLEGCRRSRDIPTLRKGIKWQPCFKSDMLSTALLPRQMIEAQSPPDHGVGGTHVTQGYFSVLWSAGKHSAVSSLSALLAKLQVLLFDSAGWNHLSEISPSPQRMWVTSCLLPQCVHTFLVHMSQCQPCSYFLVLQKRRLVE